jgi:hypothetical protein
LHRVENGSSVERVHLVADTTGSAHFWDLVAAAERGAAPSFVPFDLAASPHVAVERFTLHRVIAPAEIDQLLDDLAAEVTPASDHPGATAAASRFTGLLQAFCRDWRQLWMLYADSPEGLPHFGTMLQGLRAQAADVASHLVTRSNRMPALRVLNARLQFAVNESQVAASSRVSTPHVVTKRPFERPVFIVAAPRSGSTLLFETLACTPQWATLGGEAHWLVEGDAQLVPGAPGIDSNRLDAIHATPNVGARIETLLHERLQMSDGRRSTSRRFLEKTPKNALRIPFFAQLFPDALFLHLWREPAPNIASLIEAWRSGAWVTYRALEGWEGPWSMLLPPHWQTLRGRSVAEIAAFQWESANRIVLDDLAQIDPARQLRQSYESFVTEPEAAVRRICAFAGIAFDDALAQRLRSPLPFSRYTLTPPDARKWRKHAGDIEPMLSRLAPLRARLLAAP